MAQDRNIENQDHPEKAANTAVDVLAIVEARFYDSCSPTSDETSLIDRWFGDEIAALFT